jgi:hypothetical protein
MPYPRPLKFPAMSVSRPCRVKAHPVAVAITLSHEECRCELAWRCAVSGSAPPSVRWRRRWRVAISKASCLHFSANSPSALFVAELYVATVDLGCGPISLVFQPVDQFHGRLFFFHPELHRRAPL